MSKGLYPGNFSIFHDGHASIVEKCLKIKDITKLHIIISNKERDGITPETSFDFIYSLYKNNPRVEVSISEDASPIKNCYGIVGNAAKGDFFMVSSDKGNDYDRVEQFVEAFSEHGRYYNPKVHVLNCPIKIDALCYKDRSDRYNETPISASVARRDVKLDNFENFKTNFQNIIEKYDISEKKIRTLFNKLRNEIKVDAVSESTLHRNIQSKYGNVLDYQELKEALIFDEEDNSLDLDMLKYRQKERVCNFFNVLIRILDNGFIKNQNMTIFSRISESILAPVFSITYRKFSKGNKWLKIYSNLENYKIEPFREDGSYKDEDVFRTLWSQLTDYDLADFTQNAKEFLYNLKRKVMNLYTPEEIPEGFLKLKELLTEIIDEGEPTLNEAFDFDSEDPDIDQEVSSNLNNIKKDIFLKKILVGEEKQYSDDLFSSYRNGVYVDTDSPVTKFVFNNFNFPNNSPQIIISTNALVEECKKYALAAIKEYTVQAIKDKLTWRFLMPHIKFEGFFRKDDVLQCCRLIADFYTWYKVQVPTQMGSIFGMQYPSIWIKFIDRDDDYAMYIQDREFDEYFKDPNAEFGLVPVKLNEAFDFDN